ncbi:MAG TPA: phosphotransferase [Phenylobacterium sp.]
MSLLDVIPAEKRDHAAQALDQAFGQSAPSSLAAVRGGGSGALTYRVEVGGRPYLMRMETARDVFRDARRGFACMRIAADAGLAPPVRHADADTGVAIMDFLPQRPLGDFPGGPEALAGAVGVLVARLQATSLFPALAGYTFLIDRMLSHLTTTVAPGLLAAHRAAFDEIREAFGWDDTALVSSHNDVNPGNVIFDGERLWLIDWETAYRNDPLIDVAIAVENFAPDAATQSALVGAWLGRAPDERLTARLYLARLLSRLQYGVLLLNLVGLAPDVDFTAPRRRELEAQVAAGLQLHPEPATLRLLAKVFLREFIAGLEAPEFARAMAVARLG